MSLPSTQGQGTQEQSQFDVNGKELKKAVEKMALDYEFVYFKPDGESVTKVDRSGCFNNMQLTPIDSFLHTPDSCKLNVGMLQSKLNWQDNINMSKLIKKKGLSFKVVVGYFAENPSYFINASIIATGMTNNLSDINVATNNVIRRPNDPNNHQYSVEWFGYFIPNETGLWKFGTSSDDASYLWIGDIALTEYNVKNATVQNPYLHGMVYKEGAAYLLKDKLYPIRIQFGENWGGHNIQVTVINPSGKNVSADSGANLFYTVMNPDGTVYEKKTIYYSLVEQTPDLSKQGYFGCAITDTSAKTRNDLRTRQSKNAVKRIWAAIPEKSESASLIRPGNYAQTRGVDFNIYDQGGRVMKQLNYNGGTQYVVLMDDGNLVAYKNRRNEAITRLTSVITGDAVVNEQWIADRQRGVLHYGSTISQNTRLISANGKFSAEMTPEGNLVILKSVLGCQVSTKIGDGDTKYTSKEKSSESYLYRVNANEKMGKMFFAKLINNRESLKHIPENSDVLVYGDTYIQYDSYIPWNMATEVDVTDMTESSCSQKCNKDPNCKGYFSYTKENNRKYCSTISRNETIPFIPLQPNSKIKSSQLYIRNQVMNLSKGDVKNIIPRVNTANYQAYSEYQMSDSPFVVTDVGSIDKTYTVPLEIQQKVFLGTSEQKQVQGFKNVNDNVTYNVYESFDNHGYMSTMDVNKQYGNAQTTLGLADAIRDKQIIPMQQIAADYSESTKQMNQQYSDLSGNIAQVMELRNKMMNDQNYDFSGNVFQYADSNKPTITDAMAEDTNLMIEQENTVYILGSITAATLLIAGILLARE